MDTEIILSDSMFLFEIVVEELKSHIDCKEFIIQSQFADVFNLTLKNPNDLESVLAKRVLVKKKSRKSRARNVKGTRFKGKAQMGQSILFSSSLEMLVINMKQYPLELSLWSKMQPNYKIGSSLIPWTDPYFEYLCKIYRHQDPTPTVVSGNYNVFDEFTSKRMATIKLSIKLSNLTDRITSQFRSLSETNQETFMYTGFNSKPTTVLSTIKGEPNNPIESGTIKTIYSGGKKRVDHTNKNKVSRKKITNIDLHKDGVNKTKIEPDSIRTQDLQKPIIDKQPRSIVSLVKSDTDINNADKQITILSSKSYSSIHEKNLNALNYIFKGHNGPFGNRVYCVSYFTVHSDNIDTPVENTQSSEKSEASKQKYRFKLCDSECLSKKSGNKTCDESECSLDLPEEAAHLITVKKCKEMECDNRKHILHTKVPDERILLDVSNIECCKVSETIEEVTGGMTAKMKVGDDPCFCTCECRFGFAKKTTYCSVCGGYEIAGEELSRKPALQMPIPCPVYHKIIDKNKLKSWSTSGSESKKRDEMSIRGKSSRSEKRSIAEKSVESEKDVKKGKKKKGDERFKFNYGYTGIPPQIGHSQCAMPCTGTLGTVPKHMGWLWTADNVPGLKFRPNWKPGATNKHVVRLLRIAKNPGEILTKRRKKDTGKKKRPLKRPLLIVHKKDGEYTVTMEAMKMYSKPRAINQHPYEDKDPITYTIGRTEEENRERRKKKERALRRLERAERHFIQSAFKDMCQEICLKTYQQALGLLPNAEDPECLCYPAEINPDKTNVNVSCSCSEVSSADLYRSDTDSDEWVVEFTPPVAYFDQSYKGKKVLKVDGTSQYSYLDYKVKLLDRFGNPVPRFFKGPDGKEECSDLGGFWSPDHKWLEINIDGFIGPDGKWAPNIFTGPNGEQVDAETGKFQMTNGRWLVVGVDGYVDSQGKWRFYPKPKENPKKKHHRIPKKRGAGDVKDDKLQRKTSETTWSCFGDVTPKQLSKMGIVGHGPDRKLLVSTLKKLMSQGEDVKIPEPSKVPYLPKSKKKNRKSNVVPSTYGSQSYFMDRMKCRHPVPSDKGIVAVDARGNKTYFRLKDYRNRRPKERLADLAEQGISLSSFHVPCFSSFINSEIMKQQQCERILNMVAKSVATQVGC